MSDNHRLIDVFLLCSKLAARFMGPLKGEEKKDVRRVTVTAVAVDEATQWPWALYV